MLHPEDEQTFLEPPYSFEIIISHINIQLRHTYNHNNPNVMVSASKSYNRYGAPCRIAADDGTVRTRRFMCVYMT